MRRIFFLSLFFSHFIFSPVAEAQPAVETQRQYLSGHGCDDMVEWDFQCSLTRGQSVASQSDGRNAGQWTKIGVPSCWELQGFGTYQYGMRFYGKATPEGIADEHGKYKTEFTLPQEWQGRQIQLVFEAAFTEIRVQINGRKAGNGTYQGGFTRHTIDVSDRVFFGKKSNRLEVEVLKESTQPQVNLAERRADYWNFGGIWRPVFIVSKPAQNIQRVAIDAKHDGRFMADVFLNRAVPGSSVCVDVIDTNGKKVAESPAFPVSSDGAKVDFNVKGVKAWNAEQPNLYTAVFTLKSAEGRTLHTERQRFGFRTIEYRHSYAQPLPSQQGEGAGVGASHVYGCKEDGLFINGQKVIVKGANRHSFRPETGRTLSKQKNIEDVLLIKSMNMNAVRLSHYPADPEFLDACDSLGLYVECEQPGWHWPHETITGSQIVEEMVTRDVNHPSIIFWSNGNEGGFNYELEPVFYKFDPQQRVVLYPWANRNGFETKHYRSWGETAEYMRQKEIFMPTEFLHGLYDGGHGAGLKDYWELMMSNPRCAGGFLWDLMDQGVVRTDMNGIVDCMGNFGSDGIVGPHMEKEGSYYTIKEVWSPIQVEMNGEKLTISNCYNFTNLKDCRFTYRYLQTPAFGKSDTKTLSQGTLSAGSVEPFASVTIDKPKGNGDVLQITANDPQGVEVYTWNFKSDAIAVSDGAGTDCTQTETDDELSVSAAGRTYTFSKKDGRLKQVAVAGKTIMLGNGPRFVAAKRSDRSQDGFYNHDDKEAFQKKTDYTEYQDQGSFAGFDFKNGVLTARYLHGSLNSIQWSFSSTGDVSLSADYYFNGVVDLLGICFDYPEQQVKSKLWVGKGPYRVWQNRMEGPQYGLWQNDYNDPIPGETFEYPEFKGYFADVRWMQIETSEGKIGIINPSDYVGIYTPRDGRDHILYTLPETGISILKAIPAVRNKVNTTDLNGPSAQPYWSKGKGNINTILRFER
ncbi:MAG: glycoside hydrolase family 2 [Prevotella sp.]|nr:glycoside hydrolase family 2 [Prevotella sp.]